MNTALIINNGQDAPLSAGGQIQDAAGDNVVRINALEGQKVTQAGHPFTGVHSAYLDTTYKLAQNTDPSYGEYIVQFIDANNFEVIPNGRDVTVTVTSILSANSATPTTSGTPLYASATEAGKLTTVKGTLVVNQVAKYIDANTIRVDVLPVEVVVSGGAGGPATAVQTDADPATNLTGASEGDIAYDTTDNELQTFDGTSWNSTGGGGATGGVGGAASEIVYIEDTGVLVNNTNYTITHNLGVTQADVEAGRYAVQIVKGSGTLGAVAGYGRVYDTQQGFTSQRWNASAPVSTALVEWQANTLGFRAGSAAIATTSKIRILKLY